MLYQSTKVLMGEDQCQHLKLTRDIVSHFNDLFCKGNQYKNWCKEARISSFPVFIKPDAIIMKEVARIMSLLDGTSKMSRSDPNDASQINIRPNRSGTRSNDAKLIPLRASNGTIQNGPRRLTY